MPEFPMKLITSANYLGFRDEFEAGFQRSKRGNLWRTYAGSTLTVFKQRNGRYAWCIATGDATRYSRDTFQFEADALYLLACEFGLGDPVSCVPEWKDDPL